LLVDQHHFSAGAGVRPRGHQNGTNQVFALKFHYTPFGAIAALDTLLVPKFQTFQNASFLP
jgi:hypothetical protein